MRLNLSEADKARPSASVQARLLLAATVTSSMDVKDRIEIACIAMLALYRVTPDMSASYCLLVLDALKGMDH